MKKAICVTILSIIAAAIAGFIKYKAYTKEQFSSFPMEYGVAITAATVFLAVMIIGFVGLLIISKIRK